ncbi:MAG: DUF481 domain-containing protein [Anaeromyxobacter sp.]
MRLHRISRLLALLLPLTIPAAAAAQTPTFTFSERPADDTPRWKGSAQLGFTAASGNSSALGTSFTGDVSRREGAWRFLAELRGAYARSRVRVAEESDGLPGIGAGEVRTLSQATTQAWGARLRADRYLGEKNSLYASLAGGGDRPAGTRFLGAAQVGYGRALLLDEVQSLTLELGYDLAHQTFVSGADPSTFHSARAFLGYELAPWDKIVFRISGDGLLNLAPETVPAGHLQAFEHLRLIGRAEADVKVTALLALGLHVSTRFDSAPAPLPPPAGQSWETGYRPLAEETDTKAELVLLYAFP